MTWDYNRAYVRIRTLIESVPTVNVETFEEEYLPRYRRMVENAGSLGRPSAPLFSLSNREAVIVDGVHVYANLLDFSDTLSDAQRETESAHVRALRFLHFHYSACDRAVEDAQAQRVDYHGARLHAVIIDPPGPHNEPERIRRAIELAERIRSFAADAAEEFGGGLSSRYRIGIDSGPCVAINSGRGSEPEPLFLGNAANQAAKLAEGDDEGVFLSERVESIIRSLLKLPVPLREGISRRGVRAFDATQLTRTIGRAAFDRARGGLLEAWRLDVASNRATRSGSINFAFHYHQPPLATIDYAALSPANSIRMPTATIFADIDGYTHYVQGAMGDRSRIAEAVRNLHVIRGEFAAVVRDDFGGRKVRFIGDCIHAVYSAGDSRQVDEMQTVTLAIHLAGALRSSFNLSKNLLVGIGQLGLAIGMDLGPTPISRIGIRGTRSVRVSISKSSISSEDRQSVSDGVTTAIGESAYAAASAAARSYFRHREVNDMTYDVAEANVPVVATPATLETTEPRAHAD